MTDIEIARNYKMQNICKLAKKLGVKKDGVINFGKYKCKIGLTLGKKKGKLILVTAINPTKAGIGKTTVSIGLADAFTFNKKKCCLALREPSMGPIFGIKGGACGGGYSQIVPMEDINLHFTGDFHAVTSANNLLCSIVDNHIFQGNELNVDINNIFIKRALDLNERALRDITINSSYQRKDGFIITAATEVMAIMCVATSIIDLKTRLGNILVGLNTSGEPLYAKDFKAEEAMTILLKDALMPNLVQTMGGTPALVHMGPFANIAHGCNSLIATKLALSRADYVITEAGFGADLGAEKFLDFKCRIGNLTPDVVVLVATIKALKMHGGLQEDNLKAENLEAIKQGIQNLQHHISVIKDEFKLPVVVAINKHTDDTSEEIKLVKRLITNVPVAECDVWAKGGKGADTLYDITKTIADGGYGNFTKMYENDDSVEDKIKAVVKKVYGGKSVSFSEAAYEKIRQIKRWKKDYLPIIIAKTQFSLSCDKHFINVPKDFEVNVRDIELKTGAGYITVICGNMLLMPALNKKPLALGMAIDDNGNINGLS